MKKRSVMTLMVAVVALCVALVGCGQNPEEEAKKNFVGTWAIDGMVSDGVELSEEELSFTKTLGVYITLDEDGKATFEMFGQAVDGTWEAKDATTALFKLTEDDADEAGLNGEQEMTVADGKLTMATDTESMTFVQIDPSEKTSTDLDEFFSNIKGDEADESVEDIVDDELAEDAGVEESGETTE